MSSILPVLRYENLDVADEGITAVDGSELWFVAHTKPRQEERAESNLRTLGIETFLPMTRELGRRRSRRSRVAPFFPSYLFVKCDVTAMLHKITYTRGVHRMLGTVEGPQPIDPQIIDSIRERVGDDGLVRVETSFKAGDVVRVTAGPLEDFSGVFQAYRKPSERAEILLRTVTGCFRALVDCDSLEAS